MTDGPDSRFTETELAPFFDRLFPQGVAGSDVLTDITPEGWGSSPLLACFHPSVEQLHRETLHIHRNVEQLRLMRHERESPGLEFSPSPGPTYEEVTAEWMETEVNARKEVAEVVGMCLWDVFSDNHEVIAADGRIVDTGSFRGSAAFLDGWIGARADEPGKADYMRFYMGTVWIRGRAILGVVYRMIFARLKAVGADWKYRFPELHAVDLSSERRTVERPVEEPSSEDQRQAEAEVHQFRAGLAQISEQARREARSGPPPEIVRAYENIYGRAPLGWPPV